MIATQEDTTIGGGVDERPRCLEGSKTDRLCWRPAVERRYSNDVEPSPLEHDQDADSGRLKAAAPRLGRSGSGGDPT